MTALSDRPLHRVGAQPATCSCSQSRGRSQPEIDSAKSVRVCFPSGPLRPDTRPLCLNKRTVPLRPGKGDIPLGMEHVGVQVCDPLPPARCDVEIADRGLDMGIHAIPVELRVKVYDIRRRNITELSVEARLLKLMKERLCFSDVMRIAELPDEIGGAQE